METTTKKTELLGGFAPLVVAALLALLVVLAVPSVAPEHIVSVPADEAEAEAEPSTTTTATTAAPADTTVTTVAPTETTVAP